MTFRYIITEQDYLQFNIYHHAHSPQNKKLTNLLRILLPVMLLLIAFISDKKFMGPTIFAAVLASALAVVLLPKLFEKTIVLTVKGAMKEGKHNEFIGEKTLYLLEDRLRLEDSNRVVENLYQSVERIASDGERFYIYTGAISAYIIPVSIFNNEEEKQGFIDFIKAKANIA